MIDEQIKEFLKNKPGYLKKNPFTVIERMQISIDYKDKIKQIQKELRDRIWTDINSIKEPTPKGNIHVVSGCWHAPWHNKQMQKGLCELITDLGSKIGGFHLLGDVLDCHSLSHHERGKVPIPGVTLGWEYEEGNKFLDKFDEVLPANIEKNYLWGNHEDRYKRYTKDSDIAKVADALTSPTQALNLKKRGYKVYENWSQDFFQIGKHLIGFHGNWCTKTPARTQLEKLGRSCIFTHSHRLDVYYNLDQAAFNIGFGGDKDAPCFKFENVFVRQHWKNAFALVTIDDEGYFHTQVIPVINNKFYYNGKQYGSR